MTNDEWAAAGVCDMSMNRRNLLATVALFGLAAFAFAAEPADEDAPSKALLRKSFLGQKPPEIISEPAHWLGEPPFTKLEQLRGHVVWLQFNF